MAQQKVIVSIQGNIGSGKSTLVSNLKKMYKDNSNICFLQEPVDIWTTIKDENGDDIITNYYKDQEKYAFPFQMMTYISRLSQLREVMKQDFDIIITERSIETDKNVFAKMLFDNKKIDFISYQIYLKWFDEFKHELTNEKIVYVNTTPETAYKRVLKRSRPGEVIPLEYLKTCGEYHDTWLDTINPKLVIDGNTDCEENPDIINEWFEKINSFIYDN